MNFGIDKIDPNNWQVWLADEQDVISLDNTYPTPEDAEKRIVALVEQQRLTSVKQILYQLGNYVTLQDLNRLSLLVLKQRRSVVLVTVVSDIIITYSESQAKEDEVVSLLTDLCELHFRS